MYTYPHTIDSGNGESITFLGRTQTPRGVRIDVENFVAPDAGPPMHVHHFEDETFTVVEGRIGYERAGEPAAFAGPGETITFHAGELHRFWNAGEGPLRCTGFIEPAGNIEYFLTCVYASLRASGGHRPGLFDSAFLMRRYRTEFAMTDIPAPVLRFVFPVVVALGRLLGKYGKYADAPAPRHSTAAPVRRSMSPVLLPSLAALVLAAAPAGAQAEHVASPLSFTASASDPGANLLAAEHVVGRLEAA